MAGAAFYGSSGFFHGFNCRNISDLEEMASLLSSEGPNSTKLLLDDILE
jgi:hypothetical protein